MAGLPAPLNPLADMAGDGAAPLNALAGSPTFGTAPTLADAWDRNSKIYGDFVAKERASGIQAGLLDPETGWPTGAALVDAAHQYGQALIGGTSTPGMKGAALMSGENTLAGPAPGIRAYHGSPHSFDQFDLKAIGTGEGAQAYGHGLYMADSEGVARSYRDALAPGHTPTLNNTPFGDLDPATRGVAQWIRNTGAHPETIAAIADQRAAKALSDAKELGLDDLGEVVAGQHIDTATAARALAQGGKWEIGTKPNGHMYEVNINANPEHFLDWDKPLSEQHPHVQETLAKMNAPYTTAPHVKTGRDLYNELVGNEFRNRPGELVPDAHANASQALKAAGIPGIRYLDGGSRAGGEGSRNSVIFDPATIEILRKYGLAGLTAGGAAAVAANRDGSQ